ncbi:MAG: hypothetical protein MNPFHGCM_01158 [Gemmatimonadaceae bacterium]|nr:hypothetical protein [Gemmatimonadaceae bacterium]
MTPAHLLDRTRRALRLAAGLYATGAAAISAAVIHIMIRAFVGSPPVAATIPIVLAAAIAWWAEFRRRGASKLTLERCALWVEERVPTMQYALVSALAMPSTSPGLGLTVDATRWQVVERDALRRALRRTGVLLLAAALLWVAGSRVAGEAGGGMVSRGGPGGIGGTLRVRIRVTPPAYARLARQALDDPASVRALAGSSIEIEVSDSVATLRIGDHSLPAQTTSSGGRLARLVTPARTQALTVASPHGSRVVVVEVIPDSVPSVTLLRPARDSVLRAPTGSIPLGAVVHDDFGIVRAAFEYIVSSGDGESFTFGTGSVGERRLGGNRTGELSASLDLSAIQLKPGDIVHLRAVARDGNTVTGPGIGRSETRTLRVARAGEYDSVAVEGAAPPEEDKSVLSQRMLINLTEALRGRRRALPRDRFVAESARLARDQARLRRQVGDIVFDRLGDSPGGEHAHDETDADRVLTADELLKAAEEATKVESELLDFGSDETPVTAVNRPLLEAYNAMWDAGRELGIAQPERALPHMYRALAAIQRARAAERLYLRGRAPRVVVDIPRVRLQGKDKGVPSARTPHQPADTAQLTDRRRFAAALARLMATPASAIDSFLVLRVSLLDRNADAARALAAATDALRAGHDATGELQQARRALDEPLVVADSVSRWSRGSGSQ